jgi:hypothetical protein
MSDKGKPVIVLKQANVTDVTGYSVALELHDEDGVKGLALFAPDVPREIYIPLFSGLINHYGAEGDNQLIETERLAAGIGVTVVSTAAVERVRENRGRPIVEVRAALYNDSDCHEVWLLSEAGETLLVRLDNGEPVDKARNRALTAAQIHNASYMEATGPASSGAAEAQGIGEWLVGESRQQRDDGTL